MLVLVEPLLGGREALPVRQRRRQRDFLPLRMERRILEGREFREEIIHEQRELSIALGVGRPVIGRQHRRHRDGVDLLLIRDQVRVVLRGQGRRQIVALQRLGVVDRDEMEAVVLELADRLVRLAADGDHGVDLAGLHFLHRDALLDIDDFRLDAEPLEHDQAVTKVPPLGRSTLTVLPSSSFRLRIDFEAMTCISSL